MVGMQHDGNAVILGNGPHVHGQGDGPHGAGIGKFESLAGYKGSTSIGNLNNNGRLGLSCRFEDRVGRRRTVVQNKTRRDECQNKRQSNRTGRTRDRQKRTTVRQKWFSDNQGRSESGKEYGSLKATTASLARLTDSMNLGVVRVRVGRRRRRRRRRCSKRTYLVQLTAGMAYPLVRA